MKLDNLNFFEITKDVYQNGLLFIVSLIIIAFGIYVILLGLSKRFKVYPTRRWFLVFCGVLTILLPMLSVLIPLGHSTIKAKNEQRYAYVDMDKELEVKDGVSDKINGGATIEIDGKTYGIELPEKVSVAKGDTLEVKSNHGLILDKDTNILEIVPNASKEKLEMKATD